MRTLACEAAFRHRNIAIEQGVFMRIYNTLTHRKEEVVPLEAGHIGIYSCGPTVYRNIHIGNLRTFTMVDWLKRTLIREGYKVRHIKNITDVGHMRQERLDEGEDKMESQAKREGKTSAEIAAFYTKAFHRDEERLNILPADLFPKATEHVHDMIDMVKALEEMGLAYEVDSNVYFDVRKFPRYGQLSGNQLEAMMAGIQDDAGDSRKRNGEDFPLWKAAEPGREMVWDSPWGCGFPGWHIECSAMATKYLGERFDFHTGGVDNIFPHHENELAQSEGYTGHPWVKYWVHAQHLLTDGLKMAKSSSNDYVLDEILARGFDPLDLRYLFTTAHYRSHLNFTFTALAAARVSLKRLRLTTRAAREHATGKPNPDVLARWQRRFSEALDDDLNLPAAMSVVWSLLRRPDKDTGLTETSALLEDWDKVLGLNLFETPEPDARENLPQDISALLAQRDVARKEKDYASADSLREPILLAGYEVRDMRASTEIYKLRLMSRLRLIANSHEEPDHTNDPDEHDWSVNLIARNNREDLERCLGSIKKFPPDGPIEVLIIDNGSTDDTVQYLFDLSQQPEVQAADGSTIRLRVLFADHNLGYAAARNTTMCASTGKYEVLLDTSIELAGDVWTPMRQALEAPNIGIVGPYGLITEDLQEFEQSNGPDVDAIEGYMMAFRREMLRQVGPIDNEKFRFYRLADVYYSFFFKAAALRAVVLPEARERVIQHPHREWYSLLPEEQATKSKKNYDLFRDRWHHGESLLVANERSTERWMSHDDPRHLDATHTHSPDELPRSGTQHTHLHRHLPDHDHTHPHYHNTE